MCKKSGETNGQELTLLTATMMLSPSFGGRLFGPTYAPRMAGSEVKTATWSSRHFSAFQTLVLLGGGGTVLMQRCIVALETALKCVAAAGAYCGRTRAQAFGKHAGEAFPPRLSTFRAIALTPGSIFLSSVQIG